MALTAEDIKEGKCYATSGSDRYKVVAVNSRGIVSFVTWQGANKPGPDARQLPHEGLSRRRDEGNPLSGGIAGRGRAKSGRR